MGKPTICIGENKDADQLRGDREADHRLCFRYSDSTIPLLLKSDTLFCACTGRFVSDLFGNHIVGFPMRWLTCLYFWPFLGRCYNVACSFFSRFSVSFSNFNLLWVLNIFFCPDKVAERSPFWKTAAASVYRLCSYCILHIFFKIVLGLKTVHVSLLV